MSVDEEWRPVVGSEGRYSVSSWGRIKAESRRVVCSNGRVQNRKEKILKSPTNSSGYPLVVIYDDKGCRSESVHRLVAESFIGPCPDGKEVRHKDGVKVNCRSDNLEYGTHSENMFDAIKHGTHVFTSKTHCKSGHLLKGDNLQIRNHKNGSSSRRCKACSSKWSKEGNNKKPGQMKLF